MDKSLADKLAEIRAKSGEKITALNDQMIARLVAAETAERALKAGDACPDFALPTAEGGFARVHDLLKEGPLVLSFYRGQWCPFCSAELEALHIATPDISAKGAKLAAVTPEAGGLALKVKRERHFGFDILCDLDNSVALSFGLVFRVPNEFEAFFRGVNRDLSLIYDNNSWFLPIPATYIVARDGIIAHAYVNPDFRHRLDPGEIVRVLSTLS